MRGKARKSAGRRILDAGTGEEQETESGKKERTPMIPSALAIIIIILVLIAIPAGILLVYTFVLKEKPVTIEELHAKNMRGRLSPEEGYLYNGFSVVKANGMWWTQVQHKDTDQIYNLQFHYGPRDVGNISITGDVDQFRALNSTYITFDPTEKSLAYTALSSAELSINLGQVLNVRPIAACTKNETAVCKVTPIITCASERATISIEVAGAPAVKREGACIRIQGNGTDLLRSTDRLLLAWVGVMK